MRGADGNDSLGYSDSFSVRRSRKPLGAYLAKSLQPKIGVFSLLTMYSIYAILRTSNKRSYEMTTNLKNTVIEIAKNSSFNMRTQESGVTGEKVGDCAEQTYNTIQGAIDSGKLAGYGKSHDEDAKVSQLVVEGFDYMLGKMGGFHARHYALKAEDKRQIVSEICAALGKPEFYPVYEGDNDGIVPEVWADDDPRWATVEE